MYLIDAVILEFVVKVSIDFSYRLGMRLKTLIKAFSFVGIHLIRFLFNMRSLNVGNREKGFSVEMKKGKDLKIHGRK